MVNRGRMIFSLVSIDAILAGSSCISFLKPETLRSIFFVNSYSSCIKFQNSENSLSSFKYKVNSKKDFFKLIIELEINALKKGTSINS